MSFLCVIALCICLWQWPSSVHRTSSADAQREGELLQPAEPTLVIYILSFSDAAYISNFYFFFLEAIARDTTAQYEILLPKGHGRDALLPDLPPHARYIEHDRNCSGLSLVRWYLSARPDDGHVGRVVLVSSAVRGPFIPPGLRDVVTWHVALGLGLGSGSGLAGGVVSCAQPPERWDLEGSEPPLHPFLEFTALAASRAAIEELLQLPPGQLHDCPSSSADGAATPAAVATNASSDADADVGNLGRAPGGGGGAVDAAAVVAMEGVAAAEAAAMGALRAWSGAVLAAGMGLSSLAARQQGVDWADPRVWACNGGLAPLVERGYNGLSLLPYEVMFLPVSEYDDRDMPYGAATEFAQTYTEWMRAAADEDPVAAAALHAREIHRKDSEGGSGTAAEGRGAGPADPQAASPEPSQQVPAAASVLELSSRNRYYGLSSEYKLPGVLVAVAQGEGCFDAEYFLRANPDVVGLSHHEAWKFFVFYAQFQPRPYRLKCGVDWSKYGLRGSGGRRRKGAGSNGSGRPAGTRRTVADAEE